MQLAAPDGLLQAGTVYIADSDKHLVMQTGCRFSYRDALENESPYKPSVNALFESLADNWPGTLCAVVLTGMGNDGASGLGLLRAIGHLTLAQDEPSSAVYGMPRAARENNAASVVLSPKDMGHYINHYFAERSRMAVPTARRGACRGGYSRRHGRRGDVLLGQCGDVSRGDLEPLALFIGNFFLLNYHIFI